MIEWRGGFGDFTVTTAVADQHTLYFDVAQNKLIEQRASAAKNGPVTASGNFSFGGIADKFFAAVFLPEATPPCRRRPSATPRVPRSKRKPAPFAGAAVSDGPTNRFALFVGPKDVDLLKRINPSSNRWWISAGCPSSPSRCSSSSTVQRRFRPQLRLVHRGGHHRHQLHPLPVETFQHEVDEEDAGPQAADRRHQRQVQEHQPSRSQESRPEPGGHGPLQEVRRQPHGRLRPHADSLPFFIAFYKVFMVSVEMRGASWLWVTDLSQPETLPYTFCRSS